MRAAAVAFACVFALPAFAKPKPPAKPAPLHDRASVTCRLNYPDELRSARDGAVGTSLGVYPIDGADAARFLKVFNAVEPKTDFTADRVLVMTFPKFAYVELFRDGCATSDSGKIPSNSFDAMMNAAFGDEVIGGMAL